VTPPIAALWLLVQQPPSTTASPPPHFEEEVVVTAERGAEPRSETPAAVSVLTRDDMARLPADNLAQLLDYMPGFQVLFAEGFGLMPMVSARGFFGGGEAEYVQLLVDGVPVADVESGLADWRRIRTTELERVETLRGPGSSLYGDTALGGVVQVFRRPIGPAPLREVSLSGASFGTWAADAVYRGGGELRIGLTGTASRTRGFRAHSATEEAGAEVVVGGGGERPWSAMVAGSVRDREDPGPLSGEQLRRDRFGSDPLFQFDHELARRARAALTFRQEGGSLPFRAVVHGSLRDSRFLRTLLLAAGLSDRAQREIWTESIGASLETDRAVQVKGREHHLRAGLEVSRDRLQTSYVGVEPTGALGARTAEVSGRRDRLGAFVSGDWRASRRLRVAAGLRWDGIADDPGPALGGRTADAAWSPRAGATVRLGPLEGSPISAFAQASRAFKAATLDQRLDPRPFPDFQGGTFRISNPRLSPQRASTVEAGLSQRVAGGRWEVVAYRTAVEDEIDFDPATFRYRNIGASLHYGVEASARLREDKPVSPHAAYAWTRVEAVQEGRRGLQLKNIPKHLLRAGVTARLPGALRAEARLTWSGRRWLDDANRFRLADATVVDVRVAKVFRRLRVWLDALNLAGEEWEPMGYALPDFTGGEVPYYFPAPGRAVRVGVEWAF
jgi:outer membrane receptor protein involved in Fe transport